MGGILICDDAVAFGMLFAHWMRGAGVGEVHHASTAAESLAMAAEQQPRVIVLDHLLPDSGSDALLPKLRAAVAGVRVLLISGLPAGDLAEAARVAGADGYIAKWSTADAMRSAVSALMA